MLWDGGGDEGWRRTGGKGSRRFWRIAGQRVECWMAATFLDAEFTHDSCHVAFGARQHSQRCACISENGCCRNRFGLWHRITTWRCYLPHCWSEERGATAMVPRIPGRQNY